MTIKSGQTHPSVNWLCVMHVECFSSAVNKKAQRSKDTFKEGLKRGIKQRKKEDFVTVKKTGKKTNNNSRENEEIRLGNFHSSTQNTHLAGPSFQDSSRLSSFPEQKRGAAAAANSPYLIATFFAIFLTVMHLGFLSYFLAGAARRSCSYFRVDHIFS